LLKFSIIQRREEKKMRKRNLWFTLMIVFVFGAVFSWQAYASLETFKNQNEVPVSLASLSLTKKSESRTGAETWTPCPEPRPQICTQEYRPVCAKLQDGGFKTYSNGCTACTDPSVTGYRDGACE
jgi:hypothetical protein